MPQKLPATRTILIADDDYDLVHGLTLRCMRLGLTVQIAYDALTALNVLQSMTPDLVCLDVNMPAGNGLSVRDMMASNSAWKSIPVIILTGRTDPETIIRCHESCAYYVLKGHDVWAHIEPLIREFLLLDSNAETSSHPEVATISAPNGANAAGSPAFGEFVTASGATSAP